MLGQVLADLVFKLDAMTAQNVITKIYTEAVLADQSNKAAATRSYLRCVRQFVRQCYQMQCYQNLFNHKNLPLCHRLSFSNCVPPQFIATHPLLNLLIDLLSAEAHTGKAEDATVSFLFRCISISSTSGYVQKLEYAGEFQSHVTRSVCATF